MANTVDTWGPNQGIDAKDYMPYVENLLLGPTGEPQRIQGTSFTSPNQNLVDALKFTKIVTKRGVQIPVTTVKRAAFETYRDYTLGLPSNAFWSPVYEASKRGCLLDFFWYYLCPTDPQYRHFIVLKDCSVDPLIESTDPLTNTEDNALLEWTTKVTATEQLRGYALGVNVIYDAGGTIKTNAAAFMSVDCPNCGYNPGQSIVILGGDGTATPSIAFTDDRFGSVTAPTMGIAADVGKAVYAVGDTIISFEYTGASYTAAVAGKSHLSTDRGVTWVTSSIALPVAAVVGDGSLVFAGGKNASAAATLYVSTDTGSNWTALTSTALPSSASGILGMSYDKEAGRLYMGLVGGKVLVGKLVGSSMQITDISANITGISTNDIAGVAVLGKNNVIIVGAAGFASETRDGGTTWTRMTIAGTTALTCVAGNQYRQYVGAGSNIYVRDILTYNRWTKVTLELGQTFTGTLTSITMGLEDNFNQFLFTTDAGNVGLATAFYPNA